MESITNKQYEIIATHYEKAVQPGNWRAFTPGQDS